MTDRLVDAPGWAPPWAPRLDDPRSIRRLRLAARAVLALGLLAMLLVGADTPADPFVAGSAPVGFGVGEIRVTSATGEVVCACVLVAEQPEERRQGLMAVTDLADHAGMVFRFDTDVQTPFFMRNTPLPLSIAWFAADGAYVGQADMAPCEDRSGCPTYAPPGPYRVALEVPQGDLVGLGVSPGAVLDVVAGCGPGAG